MNFSSYILLTIAAFALAACATPKTSRPHYTKAEYAAERDQQANEARVKSDFDDKKTYSKEELQALAGRADPVAAKVSAAAATLCRDIQATKCASQVIIQGGKKGLNAYADGKNVVIYPAMIDFAKSDTHLAFVIAHEFAHNMLNHQADLMKNVAAGGILGTLLDAAAQSQGVNTGGAFGKLGAQQGQLSYSPEYEHEADYVGLYILARAGYEYAQAPAFWRQMSRANPDSIYIKTTHPTNPARTIQMNKTVEEINYKKANNLALVPNFQPK
jgi:predicted Zn-dependent protease